MPSEPYNGLRRSREQPWWQNHHTPTFKGFGTPGRTASRPVRPTTATLGAYPPDDAVADADITGLCATCHELATTLRRFTRAGGTRFQLMARERDIRMRYEITIGN